MECFFLMTTAKTNPSIPKQHRGNLFIVDYRDKDWTVRRYLHDWCEISRAIDIATGYFEIGSLLALDGEWQKVEALRLLEMPIISKVAA